MEPLSWSSVSTQLLSLSSSVAGRLPSCTGPDGKTTLGPHTSELWCLGSSSLWDSPGTLFRGQCHLPVLSQIPLVLVSIRISFYRCWSVAGSQLVCPPPVRPLFRPVSWLPTVPSITPHHLSDIHCPGREQGPQPALGALPGSLCWPWRPISFSLSIGRTCLVSGRPRSSGNTVICFFLLSGIGSFKVISCFLTRSNWVIFFFF